MKPSSPVPDRLFLTGFMGAGKSTIGKRLAYRLGYKFYDTDFLVRRGFGKSISRIFQENGEEAFRKAEVVVLQELLRRSRVVVSTGGGTLAREETMALALAGSTLIYLRASVEDLYERVIFSPKDRPILDLPDTEAVFRELYAKRTALYERSHLIVDTNHGDPDNVVNQILEKLGWPENQPAAADKMPEAGKEGSQTRGVPEKDAQEKDVKDETAEND